MEDNEIIEMMFERDESALRLIKEKYGTKLKRIAFGILQNESDAEECENDTYMRVWQSIPPANPGNHLLAYLIPPRCSILRKWKFFIFTRFSCHELSDSSFDTRFKVNVGKRL